MSGHGLGGRGHLLNTLLGFGSLCRRQRAQSVEQGHDLLRRVGVSGCDHLCDSQRPRVIRGLCLIPRDGRQNPQ